MPADGGPPADETAGGPTGAGVVRVYAAHPVTSYGSAWAGDALDRLRAALPGCEVVDPETTGWDTNTEWLAGWPALLAGLDALAVFAAEDATIGAGCLHEIAGAIAAGLPVAVLDPDRGLAELAGVWIVPEAQRTAQRSARLLAGAPLDPGTCRVCAVFDRLARRGCHCSTCHRTWTGTRAAHCVTCHETFSSPLTADRHHGSTRGASHRHPASVPGLVLGPDGVWHRSPPTTRPPHWRRIGTEP